MLTTGELARRARVHLDPDAVARVAFIKRAQAREFTLDEIEAPGEAHGPPGD